MLEVLILSVFSERLKFLRELKKLTQKEMAEKLGMLQTSYSKYEYGQREPKLDTLALLPSHLGESIDFMVGATDFTKQAESIYSHFVNAKSSLHAINSEIYNIQLDPYSEGIESRDFDPGDPVSVEDKLKRLRHMVPVWEERMNLSRERLMNILKEVPMVQESTYELIRDE